MNNNMTSGSDTDPGHPQSPGELLTRAININTAPSCIRTTDSDTALCGRMNFGCLHSPWLQQDYGPKRGSQTSSQPGLAVQITDGLLEKYGPLGSSEEVPCRK